MEIEIVSKKENQLLERTEVEFKAVHGKESTPQRDAVREKLSAMMKAPKERIIVDSMNSQFGKTETRGYAKVYKTKDAAMKYEREHVLVRNKLKEKVKAEKKKASAPPPGKAAEAKAPPPESEKSPAKAAEKKT